MKEKRMSKVPFFQRSYQLVNFNVFLTLILRSSNLTLAAKLIPGKTEITVYLSEMYTNFECTS